MQEINAEDKRETSGIQVKIHAAQGPQSERQEWGTSVQEMCGRQDAQIGRQKWQTTGKHIYTHTAQGTERGRQVWETSVGDKCGRRVWETSGRQV